MAESKTSLDLEITKRESLQIIVLLHWIARAQRVLNEINLAARISPGFAATLQQFNIPYHLALEGEESEAISGLFYLLRDHIETIAPEKSRA
jgi:hypothetical protein